MTQRRKAPAALGIDLSTFCAQMDAHLGRAAGDVEAVVRAYRSGSDMVARTKADSEARTMIHEKLDRTIATKMGMIQGQRLRAVNRGGGVRMGLRANAVGKKHPKLWAAARVPQRVTLIKTAADLAPLHVPRVALPAEQWKYLEHLKKLHAKASGEVKAAREELRGIFDGVADVWDGAAVATTDGWTLGWSEQLRFNEQRCRELAAAQGIDLSELEEVITTASHKVYVLEDVDYSDEDTRERSGLGSRGL
jgi:uncharacterized protein YukE